VHPNLIFLDVSVEAGFLKLLQNVLRSLLVLNGPRNVRRGGKNSQVLLCQLSIGHGEECFLGLQFRRGVTIPGDRSWRDKCSGGGTLGLSVNGRSSVE